METSHYFLYTELQCPPPPLKGINQNTLLLFIERHQEIISAPFIIIGSKKLVRGQKIHTENVILGEEGGG